MCPDDGYVCFQESELLCGVMDKAWLGDGQKNGLFAILLRDHGAYLMSHDDDRPFERPSGAMGRTFPQRLDGDEFYADLRYTPMGDGLTVDFAERLLAEEAELQALRADAVDDEPRHEVLEEGGAAASLGQAEPRRLEVVGRADAEAEGGGLAQVC